MFERSEARKLVTQELLNWNHAAYKSTSYNIAKKINISESMVSKILRYLKEEGLVRRSIGGVWHLV